MYSFLFTSKQTSGGKDEYLLHILLDNVIIDSSFVQFPGGTSQDYLDVFANNKIDILTGVA